MNMWLRRLIILSAYFTCLLVLLNVFMSSDMLNISESQRGRGFSPAPKAPYKEANSKPRTRAILLLSSVGRSGSSFLGEALASQGNNMYFYEPIRALNVTHQYKEFIQEELDRYFHCNIRENVLYIGNFPYINVKHPYTRGKTHGEISYDEVVANCREEPLIIVKTIRTRLDWTRKLLDQSDVDLKVIHLVRDPRGTYMSMNTVEWNFSNKGTCNKVLKDMNERTEMERDYPGRYYYIKYEDLCRDSFHQFNKLFRFIKGLDPNKLSDNPQDENEIDSLGNRDPIHESTYPDLPKEVYSFIRSHTKPNKIMKKSPWGTVRDTETIYQKWRLQITPEGLRDVERSCGELLDRLGHVVFGSIRRARNLDISLFKDPGGTLK